MKKLKSLLLGLGITMPFIVAAEDMPEYDLTIQMVFAIINGLVCWAARIADVLMIILLVYYGLMFFLSQGEPTKLGKAKTGLFNVMIGILVIFATYTIIATVANAVGVPDVSSFLPLSC
jgi:hypothetical protein